MAARRTIEKTHWISPGARCNMGGPERSGINRGTRPRERPAPVPPGSNPLLPVLFGTTRFRRHARRLDLRRRQARQSGSRPLPGFLVGGRRRPVRLTSA